ncbi:MAG: metal ABC transporter ATP-binding protein [Verrucomicrobiales bacterium]|nr:metal ABC transporter ATP-binding protein [Verrucomicrobiota bacterium JB025]
MDHPHEHCDHCRQHHELRVENVGVRYREVEALSNISLETSCGSCVALIGPNGAGKSTLLKAIAGLLPLATGQIFWRDTKVAKWSHEIAYLPQRENVDWNFPITVRGVIRMGRFPQAGWWKPFSKADESAIQHAIDLMNLGDLADRQISQLSGGQQQRVFLARALAQEAHVLLLDEPFTGLDRTTSANLSHTLRKISHEGRLIIASHHDMTTVRELYDEVLLLRKKQIAFGPVSEVFDESRLSETFGETIHGKEVA